MNYGNNKSLMDFYKMGDNYTNEKNKNYRKTEF